MAICEKEKNLMEKYVKKNIKINLSIKIKKINVFISDNNNMSIQKITLTYKQYAC